MRKAGGWVISTHFTLVPGRDGEPFIDPHLKNLRPFLGKGDFAPGSFGQALIDELAPSDLSVEKIAFSAFHQSRMDWMLRKAGINHLIFGGIVTNGGVTSTLRDAHVHGYQCTVLSDGCAAFDSEVHSVSIEALKSIAGITTCADFISSP
jgi:nicotinamidase-related amidase